MTIDEAYRIVASHYERLGVHSAKAKLDSGGRIEYYSPTAVKEETEVKPKRKKKEKKIG